MKRLSLAIILSLLCIQIQAQSLSSSDFSISPTLQITDLGVDSPKLKHKSIATGLSVFTSATFVYYVRYLIKENIHTNPSIALGVGLFITAPGTGYFYSNNADDYLLHTLYRAAGLYIFSLGVDNVTEKDGSFFKLQFGEPFIGFMLATVGAGLMIHYIWQDFTGVRKKVDEYNQNLMNRVQVVPILDPINKSTGVTLRVSL